jgi:hypothetical protein
MIMTLLFTFAALSAFGYDADDVNRIGAAPQHVSSASGYDGGETGTYRIFDYRVTLTPNSDGRVTIDYYQKRKVTGGSISWIAIATPNENYTIKSHSGAAAGAAEVSSLGWSGVRLDLDKVYFAGSTFEVKLRIDQKRLFTSDISGYDLDFTTGCYNHAVIDNLKITVNCPTDNSAVQTTPPPTSQSNGRLIWTKTNLSEGEAFPVSLVFPKEAFPNGFSAENVSPQDNSSRNDGPGLWFCLYLVAAFLILIKLLCMYIEKEKKTGGRIDHGSPGTGG